jgi:tRNA pseudouridine55 synthase
VVPEGALALPEGRVTQRPPAYSAVKVGGRRAYELARAGVEVELAQREVTVYRFEQLWHDGDRRAFAIECSSGTYVRSLIADLGDAYCLELRRTRIGEFDVSDADPEHPVALSQALDFLPEVTLADEDARRAAHGVRVDTPAAAGGQAGTVVRLTDADGLVALAEPVDGGTGLKPIVGFRG